MKLKEHEIPASFWLYSANLKVFASRRSWGEGEIEKRLSVQADELLGYAAAMHARTPIGM